MGLTNDGIQCVPRQLPEGVLPLELSGTSKSNCELEQKHVTRPNPSIAPLHIPQIHTDTRRI